MSGKHQFFDGRKFTRDDRTGYYLCTTKKDGIRKRIHVYVWEYYNGLVPKGYHVHHIDGDKSNNEIENLTIMKSVDHAKYHGELLSDEEREWRRNNLNENANSKSKVWHASKAGHTWHKKHYEEMKDRLRTSRKYVCKYCGKEYESTQRKTKFCSNRCRSAFRRMSGVDDIIKICMDCGGEYVSSKYQKTKYCPLCRDKKHK